MKYPLFKICFQKTLILPLVALLTSSLLIAAGCSLPNIKIFSDAGEPLKECRLQGSAAEKIAVIDITGIISDKTEKDFLGREHPSLLQEVISRLKMVRRDPEVKALVLKINSAGGTITASDIIYKNLMDLKQSTDIKIVATMMDLAASGGYYVSLPADTILAHPTTVTGSVGVIFIRPKAYDLMDKIGLGVSVQKSGRHKDMGSPFREITSEEKTIFNNIIDGMADRFVGMIQNHRDLEKGKLEKIRTARIFTAQQALETGIIDRIGYLEDALAEAGKLAGLPADASVITYRRTEFANDTIYNTLSGRTGEGIKPVLNVKLLNALPSYRTGFYYLWWPGDAAGTNQ